MPSGRQNTAVFPSALTPSHSSYHIYAEINMKKSKILLLLLILSLCVSMLALPALATEETSESTESTEETISVLEAAPDVSAASAILMDTETGDIYYESNINEQRAPASTTKIMTALLVIEAIENGQYTLDDSVAAYDDCQEGMDEDSSNASPVIEPGEVLSVRDLLYCAMLVSANEACNILAEYTAGSISDFVTMMNERAAELGCTDTHFANPSGLENSDHYSTARDMALIAREAVSHDSFVALCSSSSYTVDATNVNDSRSLTNTNKFVDPDSSFYNADVYGVKTGYLDVAGGCLVTAIEKDDIDLIAVVLGDVINDDGDYRYTDTAAIFSWLYDNFSYRQVLSSTDSVIKVPVTLATSDTVSGRPDESITVLLPNDFDMDTLEYEYVIYSERDATPLVAPVSAGTILGEVTVRVGDRVFGTVNIVATNSADLSKSVYLKSAVKSVLQQPVIHRLLVILIIIVALYIILSYLYFIQHSRYKRSVNRAKRARAERLALRENFPGAQTDEDELLYEDDSRESRPGFFTQLVERINERLEARRARREEDEYDDGEDYDEAPADETSEDEAYR